MPANQASLPLGRGYLGFRAQSVRRQISREKLSNREVRASMRITLACKDQLMADATPYSPAGSRSGSEFTPEGSPAPKNQDEIRGTKTFHMWPFRYFGQYTEAWDVLDPYDSIFPRAPTRLGPKFQATLPSWEEQMELGSGVHPPEPEREKPMILAPAEEGTKPPVNGVHSVDISAAPSRAESTEPGSVTESPRADTIALPSMTGSLVRKKPGRPRKKLVDEAPEPIIDLTPVPDLTPLPNRGTDETVTTIFNPNCGLPDKLSKSFTRLPTRHVCSIYLTLQSLLCSRAPSATWRSALAFRSSASTL